MMQIISNNIYLELGMMGLIQKNVHKKNFVLKSGHVFFFWISVIFIISCLVIPVQAINKLDDSPLLWKYHIDESSDVQMVINSIAISSEGQYIAVGSLTNVSLLNRDGKQIWKSNMQAHVEDIAISDDGRYIIPGTSSRYVKVFNRDGTLFWNYEIKGGDDSRLQGGVIDSVSISSDGQFISAVGYPMKSNVRGDTVVYTFDHTGNVLSQYNTGNYFTGNPMPQVVLTQRDGQCFFSELDTGDNIILYDCGGKISGKYPLSSQYNNDLYHISISTTGQSVAIAQGNDVFYFTREGTLLWKYKTGWMIYDISISSDGEYVVVGSQDDTLDLINHDGKIINRYQIGEHVTNVAISPEGQYIAAASSKQDVFLFENIKTATSKLISQTQSTIEDSTQFNMDLSQQKLSRANENILSNDYQGAYTNARDALQIAIKTKNDGFNATTKITLAQNAITDNHQYNQDASQTELLHAKELFATGNYYNADISAQKAYSLAIDIDQDGLPNNQDLAPTIPNSIIYGAIIAVIIVLVLALLYDRKRCRAIPEISLKTLDVYEGDEAHADINTTINGKFKTISCPVTLNSDPKSTLNEPGEHTLSFGILPIGKYEVNASCTIQQIRYGKRTVKASSTFKVKPAVPELKIDVEPCECYEGETPIVNVCISNTSPFPAIFKDFTLVQGESHKLTFSMNSTDPGTSERTEHLDYTNSVGRAFVLDIPLKCTVKPVVPAIDADVKPSAYPEGDTPVAQVSVRNSSVHEAIFDKFTLNLGESGLIDIPLPAGSPGEKRSEQTIRFRNRLGKEFTRVIVIPYTITPVDPVITTTVPPLRCLEGDKATITITLKNTSPFDALFTDFTLRENQVKTLEIPVSTKTPGEQKLVYLLEYKNRTERTFSQEVSLPYVVEAREPAISSSVSPVADCYAGDIVKAVITIRNDAAHEAIFEGFALQAGECHMIEVQLNTSGPGENTVSYSLEYKNSAGRAFVKDIPLRYTVLPLPRPSVILVSDIREGSEGSIRVEVTNTSEKDLEQFAITLETPEDLRVKENSVSMKKIGQGERRSITFRAFAPFGGDYAVRAAYSYVVAGRRFENQLSATVTVTNPTISPQAWPELPARMTPAEEKAMKAKIPAERPLPPHSTNSVIPVSSIAEGTKCQVCLTEFSSAEPGAVKCPHCGSEFHYRCITKWVNKHGSCPICKKDLKV